MDYSDIEQRFNDNSTKAFNVDHENETTSESVRDTRMSFSFGKPPLNHEEEGRRLLLNYSPFMDAIKDGWVVGEEPTKQERQDAREAKFRVWIWVFIGIATLCFILKEGCLAS